MRPRPARLALSGLVVLFILACSLFPTPGGTETPAPPATAPPGGGDEVTPQPSTGPVNYTGLLQQGIDSGAWNEGQGMVRLLSYINGEIPAAEVPGLDLELDQDSTGLLAMAQQYVDAHPGTPESTEIARLLAAILPDADLLLPYAEEIPSLSVLPARLARPSYLPPEVELECNTLWDGGFPAPAAGSTPPVCFDYYSFPAVGVQFRVFIERSWLSQGSSRRLELLELARDAMRAAADAYVPFAISTLLPTDLVFNQLADRRADTGLPDPNVEMAARHDPGRTKCSIGIFPASLSAGDLLFKQNVAHEMFHCFQFKDILDLTSATIPNILWWLEGSAEYFGNYTYPGYNSEFRRIPGLDSNIQMVNTFHLDYMNFLFFQHMANSFGPAMVVDTLKRLPLSGDDSAFAFALTDAFGSGTGQFYHDFGMGYLDVSLADASGPPVPVHPQPGDGANMLTTNSYSHTAQPWQLAWFHLDFPEEYKYTLTITTSGEGLYTARPLGAVGGWGPLTDVDAACGSEEYLVLLTCTAPGATFGFDVEVVNRVHVDPDEECEEDCLPGLWNLVPESFYNYMASILEGISRLDYATVDSMSMYFDDLTGTVIVNWNNGVVAQTKVGLGAENAQGTIVPDSQIIVAVSGSSTSTFQFSETHESGTGTITFGEPEGAYTNQVWMNGVNLGVDTLGANEIGWAVATSATYTCEEHTLTLYYPFASSPLVFTR